MVALIAEGAARVTAIIVRIDGESGVSAVQPAPYAMSPDEVQHIARGIATAVAPDNRLEPVQASLLSAVLDALMGVSVDFDALEPLSPADTAAALAGHDPEFLQRIVHLMVLGELILRPLPADVARRVAVYADALGVDDQFVRVARRYAQGAFGLAWLDLHRSGFADHWEAARMDQLRTEVKLPDQLSPGATDPELARRWAVFEQLDDGTLGRSVWEMYRGRGFSLPGSQGGASAYLAQHDFVHVLADYGTNLSGEIEVFAMIGSADPDPKGFAWLTTLIGLFETGYVADAGFFTSDLKQRRLDSAAMHIRLADALRRGAVLCTTLRTDLLEIDYHDHAHLSLGDVRDQLGIPPKSSGATDNGSSSAFDLDGMSELQQQFAASAASDDRDQGTEGARP